MKKKSDSEKQYSTMFSMRATWSSNLLPESCSCFKSQNGMWTDPCRHSQVYFKPQDHPLPPQDLIIKPQPVNSWGSVSFGKWHPSRGSPVSCHHTVDSSVWIQTKCYDLSWISGLSLRSSISPLPFTATSQIKSHLEVELNGRLVLFLVNLCTETSLHAVISSAILMKAYF